MQTRTGPVEIKDELEWTLYVTIRAARVGVEWLLINGNPQTNPYNFEGLDRAIRTNRLDVEGTVVPEADSVVHDAATNRITVDRLFQMMGALQQNYVNPDDVIMIMNPMMANEIARLISLNYADPGSKRQEILQNQTFPLYGVEVPYRTTQWVASTATGTAHEYYSTIYFVCFTYLGQEVSWLEWFDMSNLVINADLFANPYDQLGPQPAIWYMTPRDKGSYCTSTHFNLFAHGRMYYRAPQAWGRIDRASYSSLNERTV